MSFWKYLNKASLVFFSGILWVSYQIHPFVSVALSVPVFLYYFAVYVSWKHDTAYEETAPVPVSRSVEIEERAREEHQQIALRRELVKDALRARREMEESAAHELRLLIQNLKKDRELSQDPEVRSIIAQFNAFQIHGTANDYERLLRMAREKQSEISPY